MAEIPLLPTPQSRDWKGSPGKGSRARGGHQSSLPQAIAELLGIDLEPEDEDQDVPEDDQQTLW